MMYTSMGYPIKPTKMIVTLKNSREVIGNMKKLPRRYHDILREVEAYYHNTEIVVEVVGKDMLKRKSMLWDHVEGLEAYEDATTSRLIWVDTKPRELENYWPVLSKVAMERTYRIEEGNARRLFKIFNQFNLEIINRNERIIQKMVENKQIKVEGNNNTMLTTITILTTGEVFRLYEFLDILNVYIIDKDRRKDGYGFRYKV